MPSDTYDALIIGGGFYGAAIAVHLVRNHGFQRVRLVERESAIMQRASYNNQARVHNGYHYPRSFTTAYRSRINLPRFVRARPVSVKYDFTKLYANARRNSKVTAKQISRFCTDIGASITPADPTVKRLFEPHLIEEVFLVQEYGFDAVKLAHWANDELQASGVSVSLNTCARTIIRDGDQLTVELEHNGKLEAVTARYVFNCTYSNLNQLQGEFGKLSMDLKHEITEMALVKLPPVLSEFGITVMDGPFFSVMPFPARDLHTLSHVRYTPHLHWYDQPGVDPYQKLNSYEKDSRYERLIRDVARYLPAIRAARYVDSLFEVKTVLVKNEGDDGRPILFEKHPQLPGCYSVLGGKIDNIYDILEKLDSDVLAQ
jgi:glycine/D-amino acid oxidase-like deaminating enzyme